MSTSVKRATKRVTKKKVAKKSTKKVAKKAVKLSTKLTAAQFEDLVRRGLDHLDDDNICSDGKEILRQIKKHLNIEFEGLKNLNIEVSSSSFYLHTDYFKNFSDCFNEDDVYNKLRNISDRLAILDKDGKIIAQCDRCDIDDVY